MELEIEIFMRLDLQTGVLCMHLILQILRGIISLVRKLLWQNFLSYKHNDRKVLTPNFKAINQTHAELHILKVENQMCGYKNILWQIWSHGYIANNTI